MDVGGAGRDFVRSGAQYSILLGAASHAAKLAQASSARLRCRQRADGHPVLAEFAIEEGIVETGTRGIGGTASVINRIEARPVCRGENNMGQGSQLV